MGLVRSRTYASTLPVTEDRRKARFRVAGLCPLGRDSHPLDDEPNFRSYRITSSFRTSISWSHRERSFSGSGAVLVRGHDTAAPVRASRGHLGALGARRPLLSIIAWSRTVTVECMAAGTGRRKPRKIVSMGTEVPFGSCIAHRKYLWRPPVDTPRAVDVMIRRARGDRVRLGVPPPRPRAAEDEGLRSGDPRCRYHASAGARARQCG